MKSSQLELPSESSDEEYKMPDSPILSNLKSLTEATKSFVSS